MEVSTGYKPTDIGLLPCDWEASTIGDAATFSGGSQPPRSTFKFAPVNGYVRLVQIRDYKTDDFATYIPELLARKRCTAEDIMIGRYGPPVFQILRGIEGAYNVALIKTTPKPQIEREFLFNVLKQESLLQLIEALSRRSSGQTGVEMSALKAFGLALPPIPEQRAIAAALNDIDDLLAGLDRLIAKKRDLKQAAMQQLLTGQTRLPGFHGDWELKRLGDVIEKLVGGGTPSRSKPAYWGAEVPWVTVKDFATFDPRQTQESITRIGLINSATHLIPAGTLITSTRMALGKAVIYEVDVAINQDLKAVFLKPGASVRFLYYWFEFNAQIIDDLGSGSTVKGISIAELRGLLFPVLSASEQIAISDMLGAMDAELTTLESRRDKTRALKQGMMQELLTGRSRLV